MLAVYAMWKTQDLLARDQFATIFQVTQESVMFWGEIGLGVLLPMVLFAIPRVRRNENGLFFAATLTILGLIVNRLNVAITGMTASSGTTYFPSFLEIVVTASIVAAGFTVFALAVKFFPVFPEAHAPAAAAAPVAPAPVPGLAALGRSRPAFNRPVLAGLWVLLIAGFIAVATSRGEGGLDTKTAEELLDPKLSARVADLRLPTDYTFPQAESSPGPVTFSHETHVDPGEPRCATCHKGTFRLHEAGTPIQGELTEERVHRGDLCASCHNGKDAFGIEDDCSTCHR